MSIFLSPVIDTIILITAVINVVGLFILFFTCRFIPTLRLTKSLVQKDWFKSVYKYHSYIWWLLIPSAFIHALIAILHKLSEG